jgi:4-amino-4-deoxy-L-arabinose transferase-like glycosyltransferase
MIAAGATLFVGLGILLIPYTGIHPDEALFAQPFYQTFNGDLGVTIFDQHITLMIFPYIGALKTLLYWPILHAFGPGMYSIRIPAILIGAATIVLFYLFAAKIANARAALMGSLLLATDPSYLLTNTFDWGPVALEHLLLIGGCLLTAEGAPVFGFFLFGLALWNKAIFIWAMAGLIAATIVAYRPRMSARRLAYCASAFLAGTLPLIVYNIHQPNATFGPNAHFVPEKFPEKLTQLEKTLNGSDLFGYLTAEDSAGPPKPPAPSHARFSQFIAQHTGGHQSSLFAYAAVLAIFAAPVWWQSGARSAALFALSFTVVSFAFMALTGNGGSAHHIVLLWPMPQLLVGIALAILRPRWLMAGCAAVLVAANLLVVNQYLVQFDRNGASGAWDDAFYPLSNSLSDSASNPLYVVDWGIIDNVNLLHQGKLNVQLFDGNFDPGGEYVGRVRAYQQVPAMEDQLLSIAHAAGYEKVVKRTIPNSNGRPVYEIFRFQLPLGPATGAARRVF